MSADPVPQPAPPDVAAYCRRIGYTGDLAPTVATLRALHRAHVGAIPFENVDVLLGRPILLDHVSLERKLIAARRGGYCFEQNLFFKDVLEFLGFEVTGLAARVLMGATDIRPRTHMAMLVEAERQVFLADVGFGGTGLLEPLPFVAGRTFEFPLVSFRLAEHQGLWVLQSAQQTGSWTDLYAFTFEPQERVDYEVANWFTSTYAASVFRHSLTAQRTRPEERIVLRNQDLTILTAAGEESHRVGSAAEARAVLEQRIGLNLSADCVLPDSIFVVTAGTR
jgi:N-hydroxyarylamine O-acetyltransferase